MNVLQTPLDVATLAEIIRLSRAGRISGAHRGFGTIVGVGHSLGSVILNSLVAAEPQLLDAVVLTGVRPYSCFYRIKEIKLMPWILGSMRISSPTSTFRHSQEWVPPT